MGVFGPGFKGEDHRRAFAEASAGTRFGAIDAPACGAKTRNGGLCKKRPLSGERRCLRHAGPAAAKRHHERLFDAFGRGEVSLEEWRRAEHRRLMNRLRRVWVRSPWTPGATITLGEFEVRFRTDLAAGGFTVARLSPATADSARWRWRRLCQDRKRPDEWAVFLTSVLPAQIRRDGPMPIDTPVGVAIDALFKVEGVPGPTSKRCRLDRPRTPAYRRDRPGTSVRSAEPHVVGARCPDLDEVTLASVLVEHGRLIRRVAGVWADDDTVVRHLAALLNAVLTAPEDVASGEAWRAAVTDLRELQAV